MKDCLDQKIGVGDTVVFTYAGEMYEGTVIEIRDIAGRIKVKMFNGQYSWRSSSTLVNKTAVIDMQKQLFPENFV